MPKIKKYVSIEQAVKEEGAADALQLLNKGLYDREFRKAKRMRDQALMELSKTDVRFKDLSVEGLEAELAKRKAASK